MGAVRIEEPAAVAAVHLDRFLRSDRTHRDDLLAALEGDELAVGRQVLQNALRDEEERVEDADGEKHVDRRSNQIDPEVADRLSARTPAPAGEPARKGQRDADACRGGGEVVPG